MIHYALVYFIGNIKRSANILFISHIYFEQARTHAG